MVLIINAVEVEWKICIFIYTWWARFSFHFHFHFRNSALTIFMWTGDDFSPSLCGEHEEQDARTFCSAFGPFRGEANHPRRLQGFPNTTRAGQELKQETGKATYPASLTFRQPLLCTWRLSLETSLDLLYASYVCVSVSICVCVHECGCCLHLCRCKYANRFFRHADDFFTATEMCLKFAKL